MKSLEEGLKEQVARVKALAKSYRSQESEGFSNYKASMMEQSLEKAEWGLAACDLDAMVDSYQDLKNYH